MNALEIKELNRALSRIDYDHFCDILGFLPHLDYTQDKFRQLQTLNLALGDFDPESLAKLIQSV